MEKVIETNLSCDEDNNIYDHQARWVLINDWEDYCKKYRFYNGKRVYCGIASSMPGPDIPANVEITNLQFDDYHLSCDIHHQDHSITKHFVYNIDAAQELDEEREAK